MDVKGRGRNRSAFVRLAGATSATALMVGLSVSPDGAFAQARTSRISPQAATTALDIPAQSLNGAILSFADRAGVQVFYDTARVQGLRSPGVRGSFTPQEALGRILAGTGLTYRFTGPNSATIGTPSSEAGLPDGSATTLTPIVVQGQAETAWGPVDGFVATRSGTGSKTDTPIIETPQSISVVTRDQMAVQGVQTVNDALRYTPGVSAETRGASARYDFPGLRGFGGDGMGGTYRYLDGLRVFNTTYYGTPQFDPYNLERVEVIRGPASVLYGQSSPGGLVSMVSKRPMADPFHEVQLQAGTHDRLQAAFDFGGPVDEDGQFLYRLTGVGRHSDTQIDFTEERRISISPAFTWQPDADTSLTLLGNYQRDPENGWHGWVPAQGSLLPNPFGTISRDFFDGDPSFDKFDRTQWYAGYLFEHRFDDTWTVRQNLRYMHLDLDDMNVYGQGLASVGDVPIDWRTLNRGTYHSIEELGTFTVDNQLQVEFDTAAVAHTLLLGLDYQHFDSNVKIGYGTAPTIDVFDPVYDQTITPPTLSSDIDQVRDQVGIYVQDQLKWDRLVVSLGGRYDWAWSETTTRSLTTPTPATTTEQDDGAFTWRAGAVYLFDNGVAPYASYSTSFEPLAGVDIDNNPFVPTTGEQFEVGVRYQPPGSESLFSLAAFDITQDNLRTAVTDEPGRYRQVGEWQSRGFEAEAKLNLAAGFNVIGSYTYQDVEITRDTPATTGEASLEGKVPYNVPRQMASLWLDYEVQTGPLEGLGLGAGVRYVGSSWADSANTTKVPAYTLVDLGLRYDFGKTSPDLDGLHLAVNVKNLFDEEYVSGCAGRLRSCYWGNGRTALATLTYRW